MARHPRFGRLAPLAATAALALALAGPVGAQSPAPSPAPSAPAAPSPTVPADQSPIIETGPRPAASDANGVRGAATDGSFIEDNLVAGLLTADDLPDGFTSSDGVVEGANFNLDEAALTKHKAGRIVSQVWTGDFQGTGPVMVFDFRIAFDSAKEAAAYLKDAEAVISEREGSGLKKVKDAPDVGKNHRLYKGTSENPIPLEFENHLFTVGPVAAKVFVSSDPNPGAEKDAERIAKAAAARMAAAQDETAPTPAPTAEPTAEPTETPLEPTESSAPGPDARPIFNGILLGHTPEGLTGCSPIDQPAFDGELGGIASPVGDTGELVVFRQMDGLVSMQTAFEQFATEAAAEAGTCETKGAVEPRLDENGDEIGQLSCYDASDGTRVFMWTDSRYAILAWTVSSAPRSFADMFQTATTSGPVPLRDAGPQPTAGPDGSGAPFPDEAQAALLAHIPDNHRDLCGAPDIPLNEKAIAGIVCSIELESGPLTVTYQQYATAEDLDQGFQANLDFMQVERGTGPCKDTEWPGETGYKIGEEDAGRVACAEFGDAARFMSWTDNRFLIQGYAEGFGVTKDDLYAWWHDLSGPV